VKALGTNELDIDDYGSTRLDSLEMSIGAYKGTISSQNDYNDIANNTYNLNDYWYIIEDDNS
jgi:hypothetical protein